MAITSPNELKITVAQAIALYNVYQRVPSYVNPIGMLFYDEELTAEQHKIAGNKPATFEDFVLKQVSPSFGDVLMVEWCGMHLGVETDGYTHS